MDKVYVVMCSWVTCVWEIDNNEFYTTEKDAQKVADKIKKEQPNYKVRVVELKLGK